MRNFRQWFAIIGALLVALVVVAPASASNSDHDGKKKGKDLEIYKTAEGKFDRSFNWDLKKYANKDYFESKDYKVRAWYAIKLVKSNYDSNFTVSGTIVVKNPNDRKARDVYVKDFIDKAYCNVYGGSDRIYPYGKAIFYYTCKLPYAKAGDYGVNKACVYWKQDSINSPHNYACATAYFKFDYPYVDKTKDCTSVTDTLAYNPTLYFGPFCYSAVKYYYRDLKVPGRYDKERCKVYVNYATETFGSSDSATVTVCRKKDREDDDHDKY